MPAFYYFSGHRVVGQTDRSTIPVRARLNYIDPDVQKSLNQRHQIKTFPGMCKDETDFQQLKNVFGSLKTPRTGNPSGNTNVGAFPADKYDQQTLVKKLFEAMVNLDDIIDKPAQPRALRQNHPELPRHHPEHPDPNLTYNSRVKGVWEVSDVQLELLAWELLFRIRDAQAGVLHLDPWHADDHWQYSHYPNFMARFDACCYALRTSKAIVHNLTEAPYLARSAFAPEAEVKRKRTNNQGNERKGIQQRIGKRVQERGQSADVAADALADENNDFDFDLASPTEPAQQAVANAGPDPGNNAPQQNFLPFDPPLAPANLPLAPANPQATIGGLASPNSLGYGGGVPQNFLNPVQTPYLTPAQLPAPQLQMQSPRILQSLAEPGTPQVVDPTSAPGSLDFGIDRPDFWDLGFDLAPTVDGQGTGSGPQQPDLTLAGSSASTALASPSGQGSEEAAVAQILASIGSSDPS